QAARRHGQQDHALELISWLLEARRHGRRDEAALRFSAAELLDGMGRYDEAFAQAAAGNALRRPPYDPAVHERTFDAMIAYFTPERMRCLPRASYRSDKPVFILGMPRSGTSLVEQI